MSFRNRAPLSASSLPLLLSLALSGATVSSLLVGCESGKAPEPSSKAGAAAGSATAGSPGSAGSASKAASNTALGNTAAQAVPPKAEKPAAPKVAAKPVATVPVSADDPLKGNFSIDDAVKGLPKDGKLVATIDTEKGKLDCELWPDKAPLTVANFVGLARGLRPWKNPDGKWVKTPLYDGTVFHRIIKGFMIQGGDPKGNGSGEPGYVIPDEIWEGATHNERGLLCMANRGPNTNGAQFFILDAPSTYLDNNYTIFGKCSPDAVIETLAAHKVQGDRAVDAPKIKKITVERRK